jgi:hypothetical protein
LDDYQGYIYTTFNTGGKSYKLLDYRNPESYPAPGKPFYDPNRPTWAWMLCSPDGYVCDENTFPHE